MGTNTNDHEADYSPNAVKKMVLEQRWLLLEPLKEGRLPGFVPSPKDAYLAKVISALKNNKTNEAQEMISPLEKLQYGVTNFDKQFYESLELHTQDIMLTQFGSGSARNMEDIVQGYIEVKDTQCPECPNAKKGVTKESWHRYISPLKFYNDIIIHRKDEKTGIYLPMDLNIKEDKN